MKKGVEYADLRWNPFSGCEMTGCAVKKRCWAYGMSLRQAGRNGYDRQQPFQPTFHEDKLDVPLKRKKPTRFYACFMGDIAYAKKEWMEKILDVVRKSPQHIFYFLTKRPDLLAKMDLTFPDNAWLGVTVNCGDDQWRIEQLKEIHVGHIWISFEPLYSAIVPDLEGIDFIVIGAQTNPEKQPSKSWVDILTLNADKLDIPVFLKPNLTVVEPRMELPEAIRKVA
jgi:protein gp37